MSFFKSTQHQVEDNHSVQDKSNYVPQHPLLQQYNARKLVYGSSDEYEYSSEDYSSDDDYGYYSEGFIPSEYISSSEDEYGYCSDGFIQESFEVAEGRRWKKAKGWASRKKKNAGEWTHRKKKDAGNYASRKTKPARNYARKKKADAGEWAHRKKRWAGRKKADAGNYASRKTKPARDYARRSAYSAHRNYLEGKRSARKKGAAARKNYRKGKDSYNKILGNKAGRQRSGMKNMMSGKNFSSRINFGGKRGSAGRKRQRQKKRMFERRRRKEKEKEHKEAEKRARKNSKFEKMKMVGRLNHLSKKRGKEEQKYQDDMEKYEKGMKTHNRWSKARLFARSGRHTEDEGENNDSPNNVARSQHKTPTRRSHVLLDSHLEFTHTKKKHSDRPLEEAYEMPSEWSDQTIKQLFERLEKFKKHKHSGSTEEKNKHKKPNDKKSGSGFGKIASAFGSKIPKKPQKPAPKPEPKHLWLNESKIKKGVPIYMKK